jgi:hypothetical protein
MKHKTIMSLAAVLPLAWNPMPTVADIPGAIKNPSVAVEDRGQLRIFTPDRKRWQPYLEDYVWENPNYRLYRRDGTKVRSGYHRRPVTLDAGVYQVKLDGSSAPPTCVVIELGRLTEITLTD